MKLGRPHLIASTLLLAGSIAYNVWVFWGPAPQISNLGAAAPPLANAPVEGPLVATDPTSIPSPPPVDLSLPPTWSRDPFAAGESAPAPLRPPSQVHSSAPDPVVDAILFSADRRLAVVDGRMVRVGDRLDAGEVVDIQRDGVMLRRAAGTVSKLTLRSSAGGAQ